MYNALWSLRHPNRAHGTKRTAHLMCQKLKAPYLRCTYVCDNRKKKYQQAQYNKILFHNNFLHFISFLSPIFPLCSLFWQNKKTVAMHIRRTARIVSMTFLLSSHVSASHFLPAYPHQKTAGKPQTEQRSRWYIRDNSETMRLEKK